MEISTTGQFSRMEAGSELKISKTGKFMGKKSSKTHQERKTGDVNLKS